MTAWLVVVAPMCIAAKCCVDFIVLEYGDSFRIITDGQFLLGGVLFCLYALIVDLVNFIDKRLTKRSCDCRITEKVEPIWTWE